MNDIGQSNCLTDRFERIEHGIGIFEIIFIIIIMHKIGIKHPMVTLGVFSPCPGRGYFRFWSLINTNKPTDSESSNQIATNMVDKTIMSLFLRIAAMSIMGFETSSAYINSDRQQSSHYSESSYSSGSSRELFAYFLDIFIQLYKIKFLW